MSVKDKLMNNDKEKEFTLDDFEFKFLKELNGLLQYHVAKDAIISTFLTYIAKTRLGYTTLEEGYGLQFEVDLAKDDKKLIIRKVQKEA